jgi:ketosteroid isomerase-like protein
MTDSSRVKTVRRVFDAFNEFDGDLDTQLMSDAFDPEIEVLDFPELPGRPSYRGHEGIGEFFSDLAENWKETRIQVEEIKELGGTVVVLGTQSSVGAMTDVPVSTSFGEVLEFEGDHISRIRMFRDHESALEAAKA